MGCRCDEMRRCMNDINTLSGMKYANVLPWFIKMEVTMDDDLRQLGNSCPSVFAADTQEELVQALEKSNDKMVEFGRTISRAVETEIADLWTDYNTMSIEDTAFHESKSGK